MKTNPGYESLAGVLQRALDQAQDGKGAERHANELPFHQQPMQTIAGQVGIAFLTGQAIKKTQEGQALPAGRDVAELLGAINYLAGAVIFLEEKRRCETLGVKRQEAQGASAVKEDPKPPVRVYCPRTGNCFCCGRGEGYVHSLECPHHA